MIMTKIVCSSNTKWLNKQSSDSLKVLIYGTSTENHGRPSIGSQLYHEIKHLEMRVPKKAFDLLTISMAVTAADTFIRRDEAEDGWSREIDLTIAVTEPETWEPLVDCFEEILLFLSGDIWRLTIIGEGPGAPRPLRRNRRTRRIRVRDHDCVCLFSGGLDSTIGVLDLISSGHKPLLVSHSYAKDKEKQEFVARKLPVKLERFAASANPVWTTQPHDDSMRTRSLNFIAYGVVMASILARRNEMSKCNLYIPENGLISLNAPLTPRRIGSLSTRTTHPHYIRSIQDIVSKLNLPITIINPYGFKTKGEMLNSCLDQSTLGKVESETVSCGKWKRKNQQCGKCIPCIIRRSAFYKSGHIDKTNYQYMDLLKALETEQDHDDLLAATLAVSRLKKGKIKFWVNASGPLPEDSDTRKLYHEVFLRGMNEIKSYLSHMDVLS